MGLESRALTLVELASGAEGSALIGCKNRSVLEGLGFDVAFWTASDEGRIEKSLWLLGHPARCEIHDGWRAVRVIADKNGDRTDDTESLVEHRGIIYALGSAFGSKKGPLDKKRAFMARFRESEVGSPGDAPRVRVEVAREPFKLHRLVNDGLRASGIELMPLGPHAQRAYLERTLAKAARKRAEWSADVRVDDWPINVEGMAFLDDDVVVLGLRYPVTAEGHPMLVVLDGRPGFFDEPGAARAVRGVGVRGIERTGTDLHVLAGPIAARRKGGALVWDHPGSIDATVEHWMLPASWLTVSNEVHRPRPRIFGVEPRLVRRFERELPVEGVSQLPDGRWCYVVDRDDRFVLAFG